MIKQQMIIKYKNKYICSYINKEYDFIQVPNYFYVENSFSKWSNASIFISLLLNGYMLDSYESLEGHNFEEWQKVFEWFDFDCLQEIDDNVCLYDIDKFAEMYPGIDLTPFEQKIEYFGMRLAHVTYEELEAIQAQWMDYVHELNNKENEKFCYKYFPRVTPDLLEFLRGRHMTKSDHTVLLMYSAGKDSTLSAIKLRKMGYYVDFIHFDNGYMRDADKPYLTFKKSFEKLSGFKFPYEFASVDIQTLFWEYFKSWKEEHGDLLEHGTIDSEIRCLSCRLAMYTKAFEIAINGHYKFLAEGARVSQKFMLEQYPMIERLKKLGQEFGVELLTPVLDLKPDQEKTELIAAGFSAKGWESKCLLGREAMDKTIEDETTILDYYDRVLKPKVLTNIRKKIR